MQQLLLNIQPPPQPSFQNYIAGRNLESLHSLNQATQGAADCRFIYLWGEAGSGKTHLLNAAKNLGAHIADDVHLLDNAGQIALFNQLNQLKESHGILISAGRYAPPPKWACVTI